MWIASTFLAAVLGQDAPVKPELLPAAPPGWRHERLDFPLTFAPDLRHQGFEELRFAPGMFDPDSDSYFTYVLALELEGVPRVDEAFLQDFLERYYRGLCGAVGRDRGFDMDLDSVTAAVERRREVFVATVDMYDAFVTGQALTLNLELRATERPNATRVLGLASPASPTAPIWSQLQDFVRRWQEQQPMAVTLNHLYVVPDAETYQALAASRFLCGTDQAVDRFAVWEARTTVREDTSYTGLYFYGEHTYFEFLPPGSGSHPMEPWSSGLAFGIETEGGTAILEQRLGEAGVQTFPGPVTRELEGRSVPWFRILGISQAHETSRLNLFTMEYEPTFLADWHGELTPVGGGITRRAVLERYAAHLGQDREATLFQDLTSVQLELDPRELQRFEEVARACGFEVEASSADGRVIRAPGLRFDVRPGADPGRITGLRLRLREPQEPRKIELGKAVLRLAGTEGALTF